MADLATRLKPTTMETKRRSRLFGDLWYCLLSRKPWTATKISIKKQSLLFYTMEQLNWGLVEPFRANQCHINVTSVSKMHGTHINTGVLGFRTLFKLGKSLAILKHIHLRFVWKMPLFYLNYTFYSGLLIFCCQGVATIYPHILYLHIFHSTSCS